MTIQINNKPTETQATNLQELAIELALPEKGVAMAMANKMVPRSEWSAKTLQENDSVVIIKAARHSLSEGTGRGFHRAGERPSG